VDEASQMSEPVSLLPVARFGCHKLLLLGDPKVRVVYNLKDTNYTNFNNYSNYPLLSKAQMHHMITA